MNKVTSGLLLYTLIFLVFIGANYATIPIQNKLGVDHLPALAIAGLGFCLVVLALSQAIKPPIIDRYVPYEQVLNTSMSVPSSLNGNTCNNKEPQQETGFSISAAAMCKGDPYLYSGDGEFSKMCRRLLETNEGRCELSKYNCGTGFDGIPANFPRYSSHSDSLWRDFACKDCEPVQEDKPAKVCNEICG